MAIAILPARLANQIAAGEVVERPSSVVKELVENSLDAGATKIVIDIEKGGAKRIRITDDGCGIEKAELTLALSRHATSKIKDLDDLEAISSLGFRGEALASISSVARLTLTSKPATQENAWQAFAEGRDMQVVIQPAAHPDGTSIDVVDLFFNTPARRKFLRTEKTEFSHIEEVVKRIALARFDVSFTLNHNGKLVKQYRAISDKTQAIKRIAAVCGQQFVEHAVAIDCRHDDIYLWGWLAKPNIARKQNDLCYSYVNGRMMRDKLINHAIRQAYGEYIDNESYPAFVLFLELDFKEVDVNVHPAKHEVRFHQGRYVHDFIYSVCHKALAKALEPEQALAFSQQTGEIMAYSSEELTQTPVINDDRSYIAPLRQQVNDYPKAHYQSSKNDYYAAKIAVNSVVNKTAEQNYQALISPYQPDQKLSLETKNTTEQKVKFLAVQEQDYGVFLLAERIRVCRLSDLAFELNLSTLNNAWQQGLVSQPLLLPVRIKLTAAQNTLVKQQQALFEQSGIQVKIDNQFLQIREFPALLREQDVNHTFCQLLDFLAEQETDFDQQLWLKFLAGLMVNKTFTFASAQQIFTKLEQVQQTQFLRYLELNSCEVDLTSAITQLSNLH